MALRAGAAAAAGGGAGAAADMGAAFSCGGADGWSKAIRLSSFCVPRDLN